MKLPLTAYWRGLADGTRTRAADRLLKALLVPFSLPYSLVQRVRAGLYRTGMLKIRSLPRPVISVGNVTVGGTGKTPVTAHIARLLLGRGLKVAVLSRGYGGTREGETAIVSDGRNITLSAEECGDEPFLLASTVPGLMVIMGSDRHAAGMLAMERLQPEVFIMDDGFQHLRLHRDLNILLLDCTRPLGNGWTLPAGLLREPWSASGRADLVIHTRCPAGTAPGGALPEKPSCRAHHALVDAIPLAGGAPVQLASLKGLNVVAFAGVADPQGFFDELRLHGMNLVAVIPFPDHVDYHEGRVTRIRDTFRGHGADWAITTEKDGVKLKRLAGELAERTLLARLDLIMDDAAPLNGLLRNLLQK